MIIANLICYGPMYDSISLILNGSTAELSDETAETSKAVIRETGEEGLVLLKNNGLLPLQKDVTTLNVFGWRSTAPIYGGTGSGSSDTANCISILQSLQDAGYKTNESLTNMYIEYQEGRGGDGLGVFSKDWSLPEPTANRYTSELMDEAERFSDVAVVCIGRGGGEGSDEPTDMNAVIHDTWNNRDQSSITPEKYNYLNSVYTNNGDYDDFDPGEHYLELSNTEEDMLDAVCGRFDRVIVVVNSNNAMELGWVNEYDSIGAVIFVPGTGATGMAALGEIVSGAVSPSGRTADTFVYDLTDTPSFSNIGNFSYRGLDDLKEAIAASDNSYEGAISFVNYTEGIYVGYKFYETAAEEGLFSYEDKVQYPFGYGLSYTTFKQETSSFEQTSDTLKVEVLVTNTGDTAGKEVVELYFTPPYYNGGIEKSSVNLLDFAKTKQLAPGDTEAVTFELPLDELASYDSECIKTANGGYVLESGEYIISIRSDSHTVLDRKTFTLSEDIDYSSTGRTSDHEAPINRFDYAKGGAAYLSRADGFANYAQASAAPAENAYTMDNATRDLVSAASSAYYDPTKYDSADDVMPTTGASGQVVLSDLTGKSYNDELWEQLLDKLTVDDMTGLVNRGGWSTIAIDSIGKIATAECDGPAGINHLMSGIQGTSFPAEVLMAQTWNKELVERLGDAMGQEFDDFRIYGWYGPAMNTHRSAFGGRNFEYFSEDSVLSGRMAAAEVNGAAAHGVYAFIKHFALNDQETNRCAFLLTYCNEQAMREIYLRPFELCVKNFDYQCLGVMSSFNWIGPVYAGANPELLKDVLRGEWGFEGVVCTDYDGSYGYMISDACVRAANDMMLGFGQSATNEFTDLDSPTCVQALRQASKNILYTVANSGFYTHEESDDSITPMNAMFITIDVVAVAAIAAAELIVLLRWKAKNKKEGE